MFFFFFQYQNYQKDIRRKQEYLSFLERFNFDQISTQVDFKIRIRIFFFLFIPWFFCEAIAYLLPLASESVFELPGGHSEDGDTATYILSVNQKEATTSVP